MLKENKVQVILSSAVTLLPALFGLMIWKELPDTLTTHWGADGTADGVSGKALAVFGLPVLLLITHLVCLFFTARDQKQEGQNKKVLRIMFWIVPLISLFSAGSVYAAAFGKAPDAVRLMPALLGLMFIVIGNYLPKIKQNRTLGIKISWTLHNEENWNKTHRLGGRVWVIGGLVMLLAGFLPRSAAVPAAAGTMISVIVIPIAYSYGVYKRHRKEGVVYADAPKSKVEKTVIRISVIVTSVILIGTAVLLFTGKIVVHCQDTSLRIEASYWPDLEVDYSEIDSIACREDFHAGIRTGGFGSFRLSMGNFQNEQFGSYTLYAYTGAGEYIVLEVGEKTLVIGMKRADETRALYQDILGRISSY